MEEKRAGQATPCPHSSRSGSVSELQPITGFRNCLSGERACLNQDSLLLHFKRASKHCKKGNLKHWYCWFLWSASIENFLDHSLLQVFRAPFVEAKDLFTHEVLNIGLIFRMHSINPFSRIFVKAWSDVNNWSILPITRKFDTCYMLFSMDHASLIYA